MSEEYPSLTVDILEVGVGTKAGIYSPTAEIFKNYLQSVTIDGLSVEEWHKKYNLFSDAPFLEIDLGCGCIKRFKRLEDVPLKSIKCKHGNYFIKIGEERGREVR